MNAGYFYPPRRKPINQYFICGATCLWSASHSLSSVPESTYYLWNKLHTKKSIHRDEILWIVQYLMLVLLWSYWSWMKCLIFHKAVSTCQQSVDHPGWCALIIHNHLDMNGHHAVFIQTCKNSKRTCFKKKHFQPSTSPRLIVFIGIDYWILICYLPLQPNCIFLIIYCLANIIWSQQHSLLWIVVCKA